MKEKKSCTLKLDCREARMTTVTSPTNLLRVLGSFSLKFQVPSPSNCTFFLRSHVANQVDIVVQVSYEVFTNVLSSTAGISNKFSFRHFIFHMRACEVYRK